MQSQRPEDCLLAADLFKNFNVIELDWFPVLSRRHFRCNVLTKALMTECSTSTTSIPSRTQASLPEQLRLRSPVPEMSTACSHVLCSSLCVASPQGLEQLIILPCSLQSHTRHHSNSLYPQLVTSGHVQSVRDTVSECAQNDESETSAKRSARHANFPQTN